MAENKDKRLLADVYESFGEPYKTYGEYPHYDTPVLADFNDL